MKPTIETLLLFGDVSTFSPPKNMRTGYEPTEEENGPAQGDEEQVANFAS